MKNNDRERRRIERLVEKASMYVERLNNITERHPELVIPIARKKIQWPAFIGRKRGFRVENAELMNKIQLGVDSPFSPKQWRVRATSTQTAMKIYELCRTYEKQWQLPPLTKESKRLWFDRGWEYMLNDLGIVPEKDPHLARLGQSATRKRSGWAAKYRGGASDVRAEIKRQLWNAFNGLIRNISALGFESSTKFRGTLRVKLIKAKKKHK
jgi:hypothetical protein